MYITNLYLIFLYINDEYCYKISGVYDVFSFVNPVFPNAIRETIDWWHLEK